MVEYVLFFLLKRKMRKHKAHAWCSEYTRIRWSCLFWTPQRTHNCSSNWSSIIISKDAQSYAKANNLTACAFFMAPFRCFVCEPWCHGSIKLLTTCYIVGCHFARYNQYVLLLLFLLFVCIDRCFFRCIAARQRCTRIAYEHWTNIIPFILIGIMTF